MINSIQINQWNKEGYTILRNTIPDNIIKKSHNLMKDYYKENKLNIKDFGSQGKFEFPTNTILDNITLNENIIKSVQQLLNTENILLVQADSWAKIGSHNLEEKSNNDQRMHMDYGNNTFLHPSKWNEPEAVAMIIYLSDITHTGGGTSLVSRIDENDELYKFPYLNMPGIANNYFINDKSKAEEYFKNNNLDIYNFRQKLYKREKILAPNIGDILVYRLDLWHRGTPVKQNKIRYVMNLLWKKKDCYWINNWNPGWAKRNYYGGNEKLFSKITPLQRSVLGIPFPGDKYWTKENVQLLKCRYPKIDINPYISKL